MSLRLWSADEENAIFVEFGLNLKKLEIRLCQLVLSEDYQFWQNLAKLTKLRSLELSGRQLAYNDHDYYGEISGKEVVIKKLNVNGLVLVLKTCTKLKHFYFICPAEALAVKTDSKSGC